MAHSVYAESEFFITITSTAGPAETVSKLSKNEDSMFFGECRAMDRSEKIVSGRVFERTFFSPLSFETVSAVPSHLRIVSLLSAFARVFRILPRPNHGSGSWRGHRFKKFSV